MADLACHRDRFGWNRYDSGLSSVFTAHKITLYLGKGSLDLGHKLFRTTPETFPIKFLAGYVLDDAQLSLIAPVPSGPPPPVASVKTLTELRGHISAIHTSRLFHEYNEELQFELGQRLAALLDPRPGSIIFGSHIGMPVKGDRDGVSGKMFCHSPESWTQIWEEQIFEKGQVKVNAALRYLEGAEINMLDWSVERL